MVAGKGKVTLLKRVVLIWISLLSHYRRHKTQAVFFLLGLSLGVAMFLSTMLISDAAKTTFEGAQQSLSGEIVAQVKARDGRTYFREEIYRQLRSAGIPDIIPVIEGRVQTEHGFLQLLGMDILPLLNRNGQQPTSRQLNQSNSSATTRAMTDINALLEETVGEETENPLFAFMFPPYMALVSESYARTLNLDNRHQINLLGDSTTRLLLVEDSLGLGYTVLCDLRCAQQALGVSGLITGVRFSDLDEQKLAVIQNILGDEAKLERVEKTFNNPAFTDAFLLNLQGIGLLAFLVGCFIAFNAANFAVIQRQKMVTQLRLCGASSREVLAAFALELLTWALLASGFGLILGWLIASALLPMVGLTLNQLFYSDYIPGLVSMTEAWAIALLLSIGAVCLSAGKRFLVLSKAQPLAATVAYAGPRFLTLAVFAVAIGSLLWLLPVPRSQVLGLVIAACWFVGGALLVPVALAWCYRLSRRLAWVKRYPVAHWLVSGGQAEQQRTAVAMMAYSVAMAASIAVTTMVVSFEAVFTDYLDSALSESLYLQLDQQSVGEVEATLNEHPSVLYHYRYYQQSTDLGGDMGMIRGLSSHPLRQQSISIERGVANLWQHFHDRQGVVINQALALSQNLQPGDQLELEINAQKITAEVLGIYYSYGSLAPAVVIDQQWLLSLWPSLESDRVGVFLASHADADEFAGLLVSEFALHRSQYIQPQQLKSLAQSIFQQTFYATRLLALTILLVAAIGIFCSCYTSQLAKARENAQIYLLGVSKMKMLFAGLGQLAINMIVTSVMALGLGLLVALTSIQMILKYAFGWYFPLVIDGQGIFYILFIGLAATLAGSLIPITLAFKRSVLRELS